MDIRLLAGTKDKIWNSVSDKWAVLTCRLVLAGIFLVSSFGKLVDIRQYSIAPVVNFEILPGALAYVVGAMLPFVELLCAFGLLLGVLTRWSAIGTALMSFSFFIVKAALLRRGSDIACGCFGAVVNTLISQTIYMDPPIFLMSLLVVLSPPVVRNGIPLWGKLCSRWAGWAGRQQSYLQEPLHSSSVDKDN